MNDERADSVTEVTTLSKGWRRYIAGTRIFLTVLFAVAGVMHFLKPGPFDEIVPQIVPGTARLWTYVSGVVELVTAVLLSVRKTRRIGGAVAAGLLLAVWPANFVMFWQWSDRSWPEYLGALVRLPLQIPMIIWSWRIWKHGDSELQPTKD